MPKRKAKEWDDNPEWTKEDFRESKPAIEVLSPATLRNFRGPQKAPKKQAISIRLSPNVLEGFRKTGPGWQARIDDVLKSYLKEEDESVSAGATRHLQAKIGRGAHAPIIMKRMQRMAFKKK